MLAPLMSRQCYRLSDQIGPKKGHDCEPPTPEKPLPHRYPCGSPLADGPAYETRAPSGTSSAFENPRKRFRIG